MKPYNINRPSHLVANEVVRAIEGYLWDGGKGVGVTFGEQGHALIEGLINQYLNKFDELEREVIKAQRERSTFRSLTLMAREIIEGEDWLMRQPRTDVADFLIKSDVVLSAKETDRK